MPTERKPRCGPAKVFLAKEVEPFYPSTDRRIVLPSIKTRIITENGEIYEHQFLAFGLSEDVVVDHFNKSWDKWTKVNPNG